VRPAAALALVLLLGACGEFPKDSRGTLDRVRAGEPLKVGFSPAAPWVGAAAGPEGPSGIEPDLVRSWASANNVRISWAESGESQLVEALAGNAVDLAVGGFTDSSPHGATIGMSQPYLTTPVVIGAVSGAAAPEEWKGVEVRYDARRPEFAAAIAKAGATPVPAGPGGLRPFAAVYRQELAAFGLSDTGRKLKTERRTIAAAPSENALVLSLDKYLHANKRAVEARIAAEAGH
jgi:ABC-type amino acid transport substrate-binding protein